MFRTPTVPLGPSSPKKNTLHDDLLAEEIFSSMHYYYNPPNIIRYLQISRDSQEESTIHGRD
jgi:hypothetical protein